MTLDNAIQNILKGKAILITGSGASMGARNKNSDFPSARTLAEILYKKCDIDFDNYDLQDASQSYCEKYTKESLVGFIKELFICEEYTENQAELYSLPWRRIYTTNYDDIPVLSAADRGKKINPITVSQSFSKNKDKENLCIYINGYIKNLNIDNIYSEFKLTTNSYMSFENIQNSNWGDLLYSDLESAKCIIIVGLSLIYDLDLSRLIFNTDTLDKTIIIEKSPIDTTKKRQLSRFGKVYDCGLDGFVNKIKETHIVNDEDDQKLIFEYFDFYEDTSQNETSASKKDVFEFMFWGKYKDVLLNKTPNGSTNVVYISKIDEIVTSIYDGKRIIYLQSDMGNGKTTATKIIRNKIKDEFCIFTLNVTSINKKDISEEIDKIISLNKKVVVIIEEYYNYKDVLKIFSVKNNKNICFLLTARNAINLSSMQLVNEMFYIKENESAIFDINILGDHDIECCCDIFERNALFGEKSSWKREDKLKYLKRKSGGNRRFQNILIDTLKSKDIANRLRTIVSTIKTSSQNYHEAVILILLINIMGLRLSVKDIERIVKVNITTDSIFRSNSAINELISFEKNTLKIKSSVTSSFILKNISTPEIVFESMFKLACFSQSYSEVEQFRSVLKTLVSYSHFNKIFDGLKDLKNNISDYYEKISALPFYENNHFFWLQYAIACISLCEFDRAQLYLENAYSYIPDNNNFIPFQINNQQARLYLERICNNLSNDIKTDFLEAHKILNTPIVSDKDNELNVIKMFSYYNKNKIKTALLEENKDLYIKSCKEAYNRVSLFCKNNSSYICNRQELDELSKNLLRNSIDSD